MFYGNQVLKTNLGQGRLELNGSISNIRTFLAAVPQVRVWRLPTDTAFYLNCLYRSYRINTAIQFCCHEGPVC